MISHMTDEDRALDELWRKRFGEPLPILGAVEVIKSVLEIDLDRPGLAEAARDI